MDYGVGGGGRIELLLFMCVVDSKHAVGSGKWEVGYYGFL